MGAPTTHLRQRGAALVELALSMTFLLIAVFGISEFGRAMYQYNTLVKAARDATRFLAVRDPSDPGAIDKTRCMAVYGNPSCTGDPLAQGLTTDKVSVCWPGEAACAATHAGQGSSPPVNLVSVTLGGSGDAQISFVSLISFVVPDIPFNAISVTMRAVL